jgi:hypothetical protein
MTDDAGRRITDFDEARRLLTFKRSHVKVKRRGDEAPRRSFPNGGGRVYSLLCANREFANKMISLAIH